MRITVDLSPHLVEILQQYRKLYDEKLHTPASAPALVLQRQQSALSTCTLMLAEALDRAAKDQGL